MLRLHNSASRSLRVLRTGHELDIEQISSFAPSVFAEEAHESRSSRYLFVDTRKVMQAIVDNGFAPYEVRHAVTRDESKKGHALHLLRFRHKSAVPIVGGVAHEILLMNSHAGQSAFAIFNGMFRFICTNGLVAGDGFEGVKVRHSASAKDEIIDGMYEVLGHQSLLRETVEEMQNTHLNQPEQEVFARAALQTKWAPDEETGNDTAPITPQQALRAYRREDTSDDVFTVYNRIQEKLVERGGVPGRASSGRRTRTRPVEGVRDNVNINRALFTLAQGMVELKAA